MITIDDFNKIDIRIGTVLEAVKVPEADRLIKLIFDFGVYQTELPTSPLSSSEDLEKQEEWDRESQEELGSEINRLPELLVKYPGRDVRQIMSAIALFYPDPSVLVGKQIAVVTNLEPRKFKGYESQGMIMATDDKNGIVPITPDRKIEPGSKIH